MGYKWFYILMILPAFLLGCQEDGGTGPDDPDDIMFTEVESGSVFALRGLACSDSRWVAVGDYGTIVTSLDGATWTPQTSGTSEHLRTVCWSGEVFVAAGTNSTVLTSPDGVSWTSRHVATYGTVHFQGSYAADTVLVLVGGFGTIVSSANGTSFIVQNEGFDIEFRAVCELNGQWVACGEDGALAQSSDAINWIVYNPDTFQFVDLFSITRFNGKFFVGGRQGLTGHVWSSEDGYTWASSGTLTDINPHCLVATSTELVAFGSRIFWYQGLTSARRAYTSNNGTSWTNRPIPAPVNLAAGCWNGSTLVAAGIYGYILSGPTTGSLEIATSGVRLEGVTYGHGKFLAAGALGTILQSTNGTDWTEDHTYLAETLNGVASFDEGFVASELWDEFDSIGTQSLYHSPDGNVWQRVWGPRSGRLNAVVRSDETLAMVGTGGLLLETTDGYTWTETTVSSNELIAGVWTGSQYVLFTKDEVYKSNDGSTWAHDSLIDLGTYLISEVVYAEGHFVACGNDNGAAAVLSEVVMVSEDGITWDVYELSFDGILYGIAHTGNQFVACGFPGLIEVSDNGSDWERQTVDYTGLFTDIGIGDGKVVVVGEGREIVLGQ